MISQRDVVLFKESYCDENLLIAGLLAERLERHFVETIVDVGAGTGDITATAFPERRVVHFDILDYSHHPIPQAHSRECADFFDYNWSHDTQIGTLLLCHVLQFLDDDVVRLNAQIASLNPMKIATVLNSNDSLMGELVSWSLQYLPGCNPEVELASFPAAYLLEDEASLTATVSAPDFRTLAQQVCYLMDARPSDAQLSRLVEFLRGKLSHASFSINQKIRIYKRP